MWIFPAKKYFNDLIMFFYIQLQELETMYPAYFPCHKAHGGNVKIPACFDDRVNKVNIRTTNDVLWTLLRRENIKTTSIQRRSDGPCLVAYAVKLPLY